KEDIRIKYEQLVEQFHPSGMLEETMQQSPPEKIVPLSGPIVATNLSLEEEGGIRIVEGATFTVASLDTTAVVGPGSSGGGGIAQLLARLTSPTSGTLSIGGQSLEVMHEAVIGRRIAYAGENAYLFAGSVRDNLLYGLKHHPVREKKYDDETEHNRKWFVKEANAAGNTTSDLDADWINFEELGIAGNEALMERTFEVLRAVQLDDDIYGFGLQGVLDPKKSPELVEKILEARGVLRDRLKDPKLSRLVELFDRNSYNTNMTVAENLLFGTPIGDDFDLDHLASNPYVIEVLNKVGLTQEFLETGAKLGEIMVELFQDLPSGHQFFERYSFINADELDDYQQTCRHAQAVGMDSLETEDRNKLISLSFKLIPARHHLGLVEEAMQNRILQARHVFAEGLPDHHKSTIAFFDEKEYNAASSVQDNILFGRLVYGRPQSRREVGKLITELVENLGLFKPLMDLGLDMFVGIGGGRLSVAQRQKVAIARCLLKQPDILIINAATASLDPGSQKAIMSNVFKDIDGRGLVWVLHTAADAKNFNNAIVMEDGKVLEHGPLAELNQPGRPLHNMAAAE
ncbi:MAG: ATP-binding cassette domain-containing protein, partial [Rhodospirillales bacterium]|nr:ATP-binding cassette domain-containing protein [Rhodospirillales bacterium]